MLLFLPEVNFGFNLRLFLQVHTRSSQMKENARID